MFYGNTVIVNVSVCPVSNLVAVTVTAAPPAGGEDAETSKLATAGSGAYPVAALVAFEGLMTTPASPETEKYTYFD